jgi:hypothetical protein
VVIFAGSTQPEDAILGRADANHPVHRPGEHLRHVLKNRLGFRELRRYALPAKWVEDAWRP